jgi:hypothetical protein
MGKRSFPEKIPEDRNRRQGVQGMQKDYYQTRSHVKTLHGGLDLVLGPRLERGINNNGGSGLLRFHDDSCKTEGPMIFLNSH